MTQSLRFHSKLYRANAIDQAIATAGEGSKAHQLLRRREGQYHVVELTGTEEEDAADILAEVGDIALLLTTEMDSV